MPVSVPIYMARDRAIPAPEVPAQASFTREFQADHELLQRERKTGVPGALTAAAYATVLAIALSLIGLIAWALIRMEGGGEGRPAPSQRPRKCKTRCRWALGQRHARRIDLLLCPNAEFTRCVERGTQVPRPLGLTS